MMITTRVGVQINESDKTATPVTENEKLSKLCSSIAKGIEQCKSGEMSDGEEVLSRIKARIKERLKEPLQ